jgi:hypothetical protein
VDTDVSEEHAASIFRVEMYRFRNSPGYTNKLQGHGIPRERVKTGTWSKSMGRNGQKKGPLQAAHCFIIIGAKCNSEKDQIFPGIHCIQEESGKLEF